MTTASRTAKPATWRMELRRIIAALEADKANEYEIREELQRIYLDEFEPNELLRKGALEDCFHGNQHLLWSGYHTYLNNPVEEFVLWGELIMSEIRKARKFFQSREMKKLIPLWRRKYREMLRRDYGV